MTIDDSWVTTAAVLELVKLDGDSCVCKDESVVRGGCKDSEGCDLGGGNCNWSGGRGGGGSSGNDGGSDDDDADDDDDDDDDEEEQEVRGMSVDTPLFGKDLDISWNRCNVDVFSFFVSIL